MTNLSDPFDLMNEFMKYQSESSFLAISFGSQLERLLATLPVESDAALAEMKEKLEALRAKPEEIESALNELYALGMAHQADTIKGLCEKGYYIPYSYLVGLIDNHPRNAARRAETEECEKSLKKGFTEYQAPNGESRTRFVITNDRQFAMFQAEETAEWQSERLKKISVPDKLATGLFTDIEDVEAYMVSWGTILVRYPQAVVLRNKRVFRLTAIEEHGGARATGTRAAKKKTAKKKKA